MKAPRWWICLLLAALTYTAAKYLLPGMLPATAAYASWRVLLPQLAPLLAIVWLLLAAKRLYDLPPHRENGSRQPPSDELK